MLYLVISRLMSSKRDSIDDCLDLTQLCCSNSHSLNVVSLTFDEDLPDAPKTDVVARLGLTDIPGPSLEPTKAAKPQVVSKPATHRQDGPTLDDEEPEDQKGLGTWITNFLIKLLSTLTFHTTCKASSH